MHARSEIECHLIWFPDKAISQRAQRQCTWGCSLRRLGEAIFNQSFDPDQRSWARVKFVSEYKLIPAVSLIELMGNRNTNITASWAGRASLAAFLLTSGTILASSTPAHAFAVSNSVYWDVIGRDLHISNPRFTSVSDGTATGNTAVVGGNSALSLAFDWSFAGDTSDLSYCPGCIIQHYIAWIQPSQTTNSSSGFVSAVFGGPGSARSGTYTWTTQAPSDPGTYYISSNFSLDYNYQNNVPGKFGGPTSLGPYGDLAPFQVTVRAPGPLPLFGLASAFACSRKLRSRVRYRNPII